MSVAVWPSGWPTCRPSPLGYGNMSSTYSFSPAAGAAPRTCGALPSISATWARRRPDCNGAWGNQDANDSSVNLPDSTGSGQPRQTGRGSRCVKPPCVAASGDEHSAPQGQKSIAGGSAARWSLRTSRPARATPLRILTALPCGVRCATTRFPAAPKSRPRLPAAPTQSTTTACLPRSVCRAL